MKLSIGKTALAVLGAVILLLSSAPSSSAGSCDTWDGIPTVTLKNPDLEVPYEQCIQEQGDCCPGGAGITIAITDIGKFHGAVCPGSAFGFRACQIAFAYLYPGEIPPRGDQFVVMNPERSCPTDAVSYITGARYGKGAVSGIKNKNLVFDSILPAFSFIFAGVTSGKAVKLVSRFVLPKEFMDLRERVFFSGKASPEEKKKFYRMARCLSVTILTAPEKEIYEVVPLSDFSMKDYGAEGMQ